LLLWSVYLLAVVVVAEVVEEVVELWLLEAIALSMLIAESLFRS
jgi:hypothetical protein